MLPIIVRVALRFGGSVLLHALPAAGAFVVMHGFVPPHPGPVAAGDPLGAANGPLLVVGLVIVVPTWYLGSYLFGLWAGKPFEVPFRRFWALNPRAKPSVPRPDSGR